MEKIKILVATHKRYVMAENEIFIPIHVGKEGKEELGYQGDNTGENISIKNDNYCELTALYWSWKNLECDYIGLCHYRRYFDFFEQQHKEKVILDPKDLRTTIDKVNIQSTINDMLDKNDIILPIRRVYPITLRMQYKIMHNSNDWRILEKVLEEKFPEYWETSKKVFSGNKAYLYNMFVMNKVEFNKYCKWLFEILFEVENRIIISTDKYQARVFGFMSERLFNLYVVHNKLKVKELPIIYFEESNGKPSKYTALSFKRNLNEIIFRLGNIKRLVQNK